MATSVYFLSVGHLYLKKNCENYRLVWEWFFNSIEDFYIQIMFCFILFQMVGWYWI